jgi:hypothetical protein
VDISAKLVLKMYDKDTGKIDDPMGQVSVAVAEIADGTPQSFELRPMDGCKRPEGIVTISCQAHFPSGSGSGSDDDWGASAAAAAAGMSTQPSNSMSAATESAARRLSAAKLSGRLAESTAGKSGKLETLAERLVERKEASAPAGARARADAERRERQRELREIERAIGPGPPGAVKFP